MTALEGGTRQECGRARSGYLRPSSDHGRRVVAEQVLGGSPGLSSGHSMQHIEYNKPLG